MDGFEAQPTPRNIPWKPVAIIASAVVLAIILIVGAVWFVRSRQERIREEIAYERLSAQVDKALLSCDSAKDPQGCKDAYVKDAAAEQGVAELCGKSSTAEAVDDCVWQAAVEKADPEMCEVMNDAETAKKCQDGIYMSVATAGSNLAGCDNISDATVRERCVASISRAIAEEKGCEGTGIDASICAELSEESFMRTVSDPDDCLSFEEDEEKLVECLEIVGSGDRDQDGLAASDEDAFGSSDYSFDTDTDGLSDGDEVHVWGSDPTNPDSDGDTYLDGAEVAAGYDPMGRYAL